MRKRVFLLVLLITLVLQKSYGQEKITLTTVNKDSINYYKISEFFFVHHLFASAFFMTNLDKQLSYDEMTNILKTVLYKIDNKNEVSLSIKQKKGPNAQIVFKVKEEKVDSIILEILTNFNKKKRKYDKIIDTQNTFARRYFVKDNRLIYYKDLYSESKENEKKNGMAIWLIDFYLFDNNKENDAKVKELIDDLVNNSNSTKENIFYAKLYLGELYILNNDFTSAEKSIFDLKEYYKKYMDNGIPINNFLFLNMVQTELEIMKRMK